VEALERLDLRLPEVSKAQLAEMRRVREALEAEKD
jgi:hypothetical protein